MKRPNTDGRITADSILPHKTKKTNADRLLKYLRSCETKGTTYGRIKARFKWKDNYLSDLLKKLSLQGYNLRFEEEEKTSLIHGGTRYQKWVYLDQPEMVIFRTTVSPTSFTIVTNLKILPKKIELIAFESTDSNNVRVYYPGNLD